jgi:hypothetical protein
MKGLIFLTTLIILFSPTGMFSQSASEFKARIKAEKIKNIEVTYDKFKDKTWISTKPVSLIPGLASLLSGIGEPGDGFEYPSTWNFAVYISFSGEKLETPQESFALRVTSYSRGWIFLRGDQALYFLLDDKDRFELESFDQNNEIRRGGVIETKFYEISRDQLRKILEANKVEVKLGNFSRPFNAELIKRLRAFDSLIP